MRSRPVPVRIRSGRIFKDSINGGVSRRVGPGDVIVIPGNLPHWWSSLDTDIRYLIFRPDPEGLQNTK